MKIKVEEMKINAEEMKMKIILIQKGCSQIYLLSDCYSILCRDSV